MIYSRFETEVENVVRLAGCEVIKKPEDSPQAFDFGIRFQDKKVAIEVKQKSTLSMFAGMYGYQVPAAQEADYDEFWLITSETYPHSDIVSKAATIPAYWLTLEQAAAKLGVPSPRTEPFREKRVTLLEVLNSQFPQSTLEGIESDEQLESLLMLGARQENVTVVFADIAAFTEIVRNSDPASLNEMLGKYYSSARQLTQLFGGTFDKVIGDAVLSVFNYPASQSSAFSALQYGFGIIRTTQNIIADFLRRSTAVIETGLRVGMATGDVWPIDVGQKVPQVSFVGNPLNLAARIQHRAELNGLIMCQTTWNLIESTYAALAEEMTPESIQIANGDLSGIHTAINVQRIKPEIILRNIK